MRRALGTALHTLRFPLPGSTCIFREALLDLPWAALPPHCPWVGQKHPRTLSSMRGDRQG